MKGLILSTFKESPDRHTDYSSSIFMVVNGSWKEAGALDIPTFVSSQAESLRRLGREVVFGLVDDRTSIRGILRNVRQLKRAITQTNPVSCSCPIRFGNSGSRTYDQASVAPSGVILW